MAVRVVTYGGRIGWFLRKHFSKYTSEAYLNMQHYIRRSLYNRFILYFGKQNKVPLPCLVSIETVNRCNNTCSFCPANKNADKRTYQKMTETLFYRIISELKEAEYSGYLNLFVNNEPLVDSRIESWYRYAKEQLPNAKTLLYTNGILLTIDKFERISPYVDKMIINNYSEELKLHKNIAVLYKYIKENKQYEKCDITIQVRYIKEVLTNRAGEAPNKQKKRPVHWGCIMPFTDMTIFPSGIVGLCCNDAMEKTNYGNVTETSLKEIWESASFEQLRKTIGNDRNDYYFCKGCDFYDAGIRNGFIRSMLRGVKYTT